MKSYFCSLLPVRFKGQLLAFRLMSFAALPLRLILNLRARAGINSHFAAGTQGCVPQFPLARRDRKWTDDQQGWVSAEQASDCGQFMKVPTRPKCSALTLSCSP